MPKNVSYPQVYPQIDLTDYIIRQSRSGALWRVVEDRAGLKGRRNLLAQNLHIPKPSNLHIIRILAYQTLFVKPSYAWFGHYIG